MNIQTTTINAANALAKGVITIKELDEKIDNIATRLSKKINIAGFRSGKVPVSIVKTRYKDSLDQDANREIMQDVLNLALKELNIDSSKLIGDPRVIKFDKNDKQIDVEIKISILPNFSVDGLEEKLPTPNIPKPTTKDIQTRIEDIAISSAPLVDSKAKVIKNGLVGNIDFEGFINGKSFEGGKASNVDLYIGEGRFIAGFEEGLIGAKVGEERKVNVTFPKDYHSADLAGKQAVFHVKLNAIKEKKQPTIDDAFAQRILNNPNATLEELKATLASELEQEFKNIYYSGEIKAQCLNALESALSFDLPDIIVEQEMDMLFRNALAGVSKDELKTYQNDPQKAKDKRESFRDEAKKSVKVTFIIDSLAKKRGVKVSDNEVANAVYYEASMHGHNPKEALEYYQKNNILPAIKMAMIEDKLLRLLLDEKASNIIDKQKQRANIRKLAKEASNQHNKKQSNKDNKKSTADSSPKSIKTTPIKSTKTPKIKA